MRRGVRPRHTGNMQRKSAGILRPCFPNGRNLSYHELISDLVHIDVNIMRPTEERPYYVMYTTGMSDMPMTLPEEIADRGGFKGYAELFMFLPGSGIQEKPDSWIPTYRTVSTGPSD